MREDPQPCPPCSAGRHDTCTDTLPLGGYFRAGSFAPVTCECENAMCPPKRGAA